MEVLARDSPTLVSTGEDSSGVLFFVLRITLEDVSKLEKIWKTTKMIKGLEKTT